MKKNFVFSLILISFLVVSLAYVSAADTSYTYTKGGNSLKFSLTVPSGWKIDDSGKNGAPVFLMGPKDSDFNININVTYEKCGTITLKEYVKKAFSYKSESIKEQKVVSDKNLTIDGKEAYQAQVDYTFNVQGGTFSTKTMQTIVLKDGYAYVITGSAVKDNYKKFEDIFKNVASSFKFK